MIMSEVIHLAKKSYAIPGSPEKDIYLLPVSGGADSTALAILLHAMFPQIPFKMVFTDTLAETAEVYSTLDALEAYLNKPIERIKPDKGLFELIDHYKGFLPSASSRFCTRDLKLRPFQKWISQFEGIQKWMFIGIRADESNRIAFTLKDVETEMPLVDMQMHREDIFNILDKTIGIPQFYRHRTRSGCSVCPFQRRSEIVGLLQERPIEFIKGMGYEKLSEENSNRHQEATPLWKDSGIAANWLTLPMPIENRSIEGKKPKRASMDIFGNRGIFIGGEFFMDGFISLDEFVWHQKIVSYSPTLHGIRRQLDDRYRHLLSTGEVYGMSPDDVRNKVKFAIWYIELPDDVFDPDGPKGEGYTWQQGASYKQLRHIISMATRVLHAEGMRIESLKQANELSVQYEWAESSKLGLANITEAVGQVSNSEWHKPSELEPVLNEREELSTLPCPMCHL